MDRERLIAALQCELDRHPWDYFQEPVDGRHVTVPGCPHCKVRLDNQNQFLDHLAHDVVPRVIREWPE